MEKIEKSLPKISCAHRIFSVYPQDSYTEPPNPAILVHKCDELTVLQNFRGIRRYFLQNGTASEPEAESPDNFLEGLMGGEEQDTSGEVIEERLGEGDGETGVPF